MKHFAAVAVGMLLATGCSNLPGSESTSSLQERPVDFPL